MRSHVVHDGIFPNWWIQFPVYTKVDKNRVIELFGGAVPLESGSLVMTNIMRYRVCIPSYGKIGARVFMYRFKPNPL